MDSLKVLYLVILIVGCATAHSYLTNPISRGNQKVTQSGCRGPSCLGPCELPASSASANPTTVARGSTVNVAWPRNNHPGGFVRIAWALTAQSDSEAAFDAGSQLIACFEKGDAGCAPSAADPNGADIAGATQTSCFVDITVPSWLSDGKWTMQWAWFGGGYALADYFGCVDFTISGGPTGTYSSEYFVGGDYSNAGTAACKYFNTNYLGACPAEPCPSPPMSGQHNGAPRLSGNGTAPPPPPPAATTAAYTPPPPPPAVATTGAYTPPPPPPPPSVYTTGLVELTTGLVDAGVQSGKTPCTSNNDCSSNVCGIDGYCADKPSSGLGSGGVAAIVMAAIFVALVGVFALFFVINKSEIPYMQPFRGRV